MAKIRGIKPEFWTDEDIVELSIPARLLFIGMWNHACDNGHLDDKPRQIKMRILPGDDVSIESLLEELVEHHRIERRDGTITIPKFAQHQKPHSRWWSTCDLPECVAPTVVKPSAKGVNNRGATVDHGGPREKTAVLDGDGDGELMVSGVEESNSTSRKRPAKRIPDDWLPTPKHREREQAGIDVDHEAEKFRLHAEANDRRQANWNAAFSQWLLNARPSRSPQRTTVAEPTGHFQPFSPPAPPPEIADDPIAYRDWLDDERRKWRERNHA